ncbi:MAG TPA: hypothetical protein VGN34_19860 [Ktedonobacteraceae bacterium]|jgi:hypothetical protein
MDTTSPDLAFLVRINKEEYERIYNKMRGTSAVTSHGFTDKAVLGKTEDGQELHNAYVTFGNSYFRLVEPMTTRTFVQMRLHLLFDKRKPPPPPRKPQQPTQKRKAPARKRRTA